MTSLANSLAGLSLLSGANFSGVDTTLRIESHAVRLAKAQFTAPRVIPLWSQPRTAPAASAVLRLATLIDRPSSTERSPDVASAFIAYKALERLRALAEAGTKGGTDGAALQKRFEAGLSEVERWMAGAPSDQLILSFGRAARRAESIGLPTPPAEETRGSLVVPARDTAIPGLTGTERFSLKISRPGASETISVDLSGIPQPPKLDGVAAAFNAALSALPMIGSNGEPLRLSSGEIIPRFQSQFAVVRHDGGGWGLELNSGGIETVAIHDQGAAPALLTTVRQGADAATGVPVALSRLSLGGGGLERVPLTTLSAQDRDATALQPAPREGLGISPVLAPLAIATTIAGPDGSSYAVGTSRGVMGSMLSDGEDELMLIKLDSRGQPLWQRSLGTAGSASGLSVALGADGDVIVGGTMTPPGGNRDVLVARFGADGEEKMLSPVRELGDQDLAGMVALGDGSTLLASRKLGGATTFTRVDAAGKVIERQPLPTELGDVCGIAVNANGDVLVLSQSGTDAKLSRFAGGDLSATASSEQLAGLNASSLAVASDGTVAVGGRRGIDGAVVLVAGGQVRWVDLASAGNDQVDQLVFDGSNNLMAAGRTSGTLGNSRIGTVDAFVARIDVAAGTVGDIHQWGQLGLKSGPVTVSLITSGDSAVHRLGFSEGAINAAESPALADQTALRPEDRFQIRVNQGAIKTVTIEPDETAAAFVDRLGKLIGRSVGKVTLSRSSSAPQIRIEPAAGQRIDLLPGPEGKDALAKLGIAPESLIVAPPFDAKAPRVKPGGHYGLDLVHGLRVGDKAAAKLTLERLDSAIATVRAGFRSLYWDDTKAALAEGGSKKGSGPTPYEASQLARYQDALKRLGG